MLDSNAHRGWVPAALGLGLAVVAAGIAAEPALAAKKKRAEAEKAALSVPLRQPLNLIISIRKQKLFIYHGTELVETSPVSTGQRSFPTPTGVFSILEKSRTHYSNLYGGAPMPFMQRVTWSGTALHAGHLPGYPASHGCIRLPHSFAQKLFGMTRKNNHIIITSEAIPPAGISHTLLFQPVPKPPASSAAAADAMVQTAALEGTATDAVQPQPPSTGPIRMLIARRSERDLIRSVQSMLKELEYEIGDIDGFMGPVTRDIMNIYQRIHGLKQTETVSAEVLDHLSKATGRGPARDWHIYVKQDFGDLFDAPVDIRDPDAPMGTHLFQALDFEPTASAVSWTHIPGDEASAEFSAAAVLDRISIPEETRDRIAKLLTPGSSLTVTDRGKSDDVSEYTDFLVRLPMPKATAATKSKSTSTAAVEEAGEDDSAGQTVRKKRKKRVARVVRLRSATSASGSALKRSVQR